MSKTIEKKNIRKILIANRGEIALRIIKTCRFMGIKTVSIYTAEEKNLPHSYEADESYCLGEGALADTYLNIKLILDIAKTHNVDAIHPGYGFLSENATFSKEVIKSGLIFIGPKASSMEIMGDKKGSKEFMENLDVPLIPGYHGNNQEPEYLFSKAKEIGFPVLIKASAGGGGKGMRVVHSEDKFLGALDGAKREAKSSFKNDIVLIEKYITRPRHIEIQVMSDQHGNHLHFYERECSIQRRHQKIVEECPSPNMTTVLREKMAKTAVTITSSINYEGAGTIEFIVDDNGEYYFLEMNTRLQVEHPVTEYVYGVDLVRMQIIAASGEAFVLKQKDIIMRGHAIELRIYSEDPDNNFLPVTGNLGNIFAPTSLHSRLDCGYISHNEVTINFDPMLAKLISWSENRNETILKLSFSLEEIGFTGLKTNREYLSRILKHKVFLSGQVDTHFTDEFKDELVPTDLTHDEIIDYIAAYELLPHNSSLTGNSQEQLDERSTVWDNLNGFRNH